MSMAFGVDSEDVRAFTCHQCGEMEQVMWGEVPECKSCGIEMEADDE